MVNMEKLNLVTAAEAAAAVLVPLVDQEEGLEKIINLVEMEAQVRDQHLRVLSQHWIRSGRMMVMDILTAMILIVVDIC